MTRQNGTLVLSSQITPTSSVLAVDAEADSAWPIIGETRRTSVYHTQAGTTSHAEHTVDQSREISISE